MSATAERIQRVVPDDLRTRKQWLVWKFESLPGDKKPRKVPYYAASAKKRMGTQGSDDDRAQLVDYNTADRLAQAGGFNGVGFAFLPDDGLIGIDLDSCINTDDKDKIARAEKILSGCNSFAEYSPSGNGYHIFVAGQTKTFKSNELGIEVFCGRQFFTFTGNHVPGTPVAISPIADERIEKLRSFVKEKSTPAAGSAVLPQKPSDAAKLESALACINSDCGYDEWYQIGMAIKAELGDGGVAVWDWWSRKSPKYPGENEILSHWKSFSASGGITGATLFRKAMDAGWRPPQQPRGAIRDIEPPRETFDPETGEITQPANDNGANQPTPESALADCLVVQGQSRDGYYWIFDKRRSALRSFKASELTRKSTLIELAPVEKWEIAIGLAMPSRKFTSDAAFELIVDIASKLPAYVPASSGEEKQTKGLMGKHGADSAIIASEIRAETLYDEYSTGWYTWDIIWRPTTEGDVERRVIDMLDTAFQMNYDGSAFSGTFNLLKKRLGRSPKMTADGNAAYDTWNNDRHLLPMRNGVLDLRNGDLIPHSPELMMPWMIPHDFDSDAGCPVIEEFMRQLSQGDKATETVLYCFLAAVLHGRSDLQKFLECIGLAGTGKSTYIKLCTSLVGDSNVAITTMKQLHENRFETANLYGKRLVVISDADKYGGSVDVFKAITGEDPIRYEEKNKQAGKPFIYGGMVIVAANQPIQFSDNSTAMVRRRIPIHLDNRLDSSKVDTGLSDKMQAEMAGLVNKLLGYKPEQISEALRDTMRRRVMAERRAMCETNPVAAWINECLIEAPDTSTKIGTLKHSSEECLYPSYANYCEGTGRKGTVTLQSFSRAVVDVLGYIGLACEKKTMKDGAKISGVRLRSMWDEGIPPLMVGEHADPPK